jgi:hypothetical protein
MKNKQTEMIKGCAGIKGEEISCRTFVRPWKSWKMDGNEGQRVYAIEGARLRVQERDIKGDIGNGGKVAGGIVCPR